MLESYLPFRKIGLVNSTDRAFTNKKLLTKAICCYLERSDWVWCSSYRGNCLLYTSISSRHSLNDNFFGKRKLEISNNIKTFCPMFFYLGRYCKQKPKTMYKSCEFHMGEETNRMINAHDFSKSIQERKKVNVSKMKF